MRGTWLTLRAEAFRLRRSRSTWLALTFLILVSAARVFAARVAEGVARAEALAGGRLAAAGEESAGLASGRGWAPLVDGWRTGLSAATLLLLLHAARTIAADRESGVLRLALTRSASRGAVVLARALLALLLLVAAFFACGLGAFAAAAAFFDFGPLVEDGYEFLTTAELRGELTVAALAALPPLIATYSFGLLVSAANRSAAASVGVALSLFLSFDLFKEALGEAQYWVFASFVPSFVDGSALREMSGLARGFSDAGFPSEILHRNMLLPWPQAAVFVALACWIVARRSA